MTQTLFNTQAMILSRALATAAEFMSEELARYLLTVKLDPVDESRANELAAKAVCLPMSRPRLMSISESAESWKSCGLGLEKPWAARHEAIAHRSDLGSCS